MKTKGCVSIVLFVILSFYPFNGVCMTPQALPNNIPQAEVPVAPVPAAPTVPAVQATPEKQPEPVAQSAQPTPQPIPATLPPQQAAPEAMPFLGPDTSSYPEDVIGAYGNWIKKGEMWKHAKDLILQIGTIIRDIKEIRKSFTQKYIAIGDQHYDFYQSFGFEQGKLEELFASIDKYLEKQRKKKVEEFTEKSKTGELKKRDLQNNLDLVDDKIKSYKVQLEQLKLDLQSIEELDKSLLDRLNKIDEHIAQVDQESTKVNELKNTMVHVIDHNKARDLYFKLKNEFLVKLESIKAYLSTTLMQDFDKVSGVINTQIEKTKATIKLLEEKGLIIRDRTRKISDIKQQRVQEENIKKQLEPETPRRRIQRSVKQTSWIESIYNAIIDFFASIVAPIKYIIYGAPPKKIIRATPTPAPVQAPGVPVPAQPAAPVAAPVAQAK